MDRTFQKTLAAVVCCIMMAGSFTLTSCVDNLDNSGGGGGGGSDKAYVERLFPVVDPQNNTLGTVLLRFYQDMPSVAYISVSHYQEMIYPGTTIQVTKLGDGKFALTNPCGTAEVDTEKDLFMSNDYETFTNLMGMVQPGLPNIPYDGLPLIRWKSLDVSPKQVDVTLDYGKYGIDIREDGENVYFPFATISDLYADGFMHMSDFNGMTVMEKSMAEKGLDRALHDYGQAGQMTRELLKSRDMYDFFSGTATLGYLLFDGGHTYTDLTTINAIDTTTTFALKLKPFRRAKLKEFEGYCPEFQPIQQTVTDRINLRNQLNKLREEKIGKGVRYTKVGNTAYCHFDSFYCDNSGWSKYYKGEGPKPTTDQYPNDWLVVLIDALEKAQSDPEVENFILDTSTNGGGSSDVLVFITSLLCNKSDMYWENTLTGQKMKASFEIDRNQDGKFDEKDKDVKMNMNIGVLISSCSFSCGNLLPALLKDYGICLLGKKSGGGSCCVLFNPSADGFGYRYSTHHVRLNNTKGENIDEGIEPDYQLEPDDFFDIPKVGKLIEEFYAK